MVYVTHDQTEALTFADKVVVMQEGDVVQIGTPQELFERPAHTFVGYFIGSPGMNVLPAWSKGTRAHRRRRHPARATSIQTCRRGNGRGGHPAGVSARARSAARD